MVEPSLLERMEVGAVLYAVPKSISGIRKLKNMKDDIFWTHLPLKIPLRTQYTVLFLQLIVNVSVHLPKAL